MHTLSNLPQSPPLPIALAWGLCLHRCSMSSLYCYLCLWQDILSLCPHNSISQIHNLRPRAVQVHIQEHIISESSLITDPQIFLGTVFKTPIRFPESQTSLYTPVAVRRMLVSGFRENRLTKWAMASYQGVETVPMLITYTTSLNILFSLSVHLRQVTIQNDFS